MGDLRVATDPLFSRLLIGLHRKLAVPAEEAAEADLVLVSHVHYDHFDVASLRRFGSTPIVVPKGSRDAIRGTTGLELIEAVPGDQLDIAGVEVDVLPARHDGRRSILHRADIPSLGFRFSAGARSAWYPGDTGTFPELTALDPIDLALVPIGGWGPTLGDEHLDPIEAADAVRQIGAGAALAVHYGTYWPLLLNRIRPANHRHFFHAPPGRFQEAMADSDIPALTPGVGERVEL